MSDMLLKLKNHVESAGWNDVQHSARRGESYVHVPVGDNVLHESIKGLNHVKRIEKMELEMRKLAADFVKKFKENVIVEPVLPETSVGPNANGFPLVLAFKLKLLEKGK